MTRRARVLLAVLAAAVAGGVVLKRGAWQARARAAAARPDLAAEYTARCKGGDDTVECIILRGRMRAAVLLSLDKLALVRDRRAVDVAAEALALDDPAIQLAALVVLRRHPLSAAVAQRAVPLLLGDRPLLQRAAADVLEKDGGDLGRIAGQWRANHATLPQPGPLTTCEDRDPPPPDLAAMRFPVPRNHARYPVADSAQAVGFASKEPVASVVAAYRQATGVAPLDRAAYEAALTEYAAEAASAMDPTKDPELKELERLATEYAAKPDPGTLARLEALQQKLNDRANALQRQHEAGAAAVSLPDDTSPDGSARTFILEKKGARPMRLIHVYREEALGRTITIMAWDASVRPGWNLPRPGDPR